MEKKSISSAVMKNIAYATMLIDHFFAIIVMALLQERAAAGLETDRLLQVYSAGRAVGRIAFVLFAFLAAEGFVHTRNRGRYLLRLALFAVISEVPFDLAFSNAVIDYRSQNVFFTLFLGVLALSGWEWAEHSLRLRKGAEPEKNPGLYTGIFRMTQVVILLACCTAAYFLSTDYKYMGVLLIFVFYITRGRGILLRMAAAGIVMFFGMWSINCLKYAENYTMAYLFSFSMRELYGLFAFFPIALYNGKKGRQFPKAVCYGFYPVHLLVLYGIARPVVGG